MPDRPPSGGESGGRTGLRLRGLSRLGSLLPGIVGGSTGPCERSEMTRSALRLQFLEFQDRFPVFLSEELRHSCESGGFRPTRVQRNHLACWMRKQPATTWSQRPDASKLRLRGGWEGWLRPAGQLAKWAQPTGIGYSMVLARRVLSTLKVTLGLPDGVTIATCWTFYVPELRQ